jgi:heme A synthase
VSNQCKRGSSYSSSPNPFANQVSIHHLHKLFVVVVVVVVCCCCRRRRRRRRRFLRRRHQVLYTLMLMSFLIIVRADLRPQAFLVLHDAALPFRHFFAVGGKYS